MIQCRLCNLQYIGETKRRLKDRYNEHRRPVLNPTDSYIQTAVSEHFLYLLKSFRIMNAFLLGKLYEAHLIQTIEPLGISKRDEQ